MVTLDSLPTAPQAGEKLQLGFMVRQHGITPVNNAFGVEPLRPYLTATHQETGESIRAEARPEGPVGHFVVELRFPKPGTWQWQIRVEPFGTTQFEPLVVLAASETITEPIAPASATSLTLLWGVAIFSLVLVGGVAIMLQRGALKQKTGPTIAASGLLLLLLLAVFTWPLVATDTANSSQVETNPGKVEPVSDATYGRALFVAKGCPACHIHASFSNSVPGPLIGPALTNYEAAPDFLRQWLQNPQAIRPNAQMPNPNLSDHEIEALIAFLASDAK
jgi:cytochrome c2